MLSSRIETTAIAPSTTASDETYLHHQQLVPLDVAGLQAIDQSRAQAGVAHAPATSPHPDQFIEP